MVVSSAAIVPAASAATWALHSLTALQPVGAVGLHAVPAGAAVHDVTAPVGDIDAVVARPGVDLVGASTHGQRVVALLAEEPILAPSSQRVTRAATGK